MKPLLIALLASTIAMPALAQSTDPHAGHDMGAATPADPHAGHAMPAATPVDPHAGHTMPATTPADPHAGHTMPATTPADPHAGHDMGAMTATPDAPPVAPPPPGAFSGPAHAADTVFGADAMAPARAQLRLEHGGMAGHYMLMADRLEARIGKGANAYLWDAQGWYGGDIDKLWIKTEGEGAFGGPLEQAEVQALWSHAFNPWFDLQLGVRADIRPTPERAHLVVGIQGLMPYWFEIDAAAFLSDKGDLTGRVEAEYDQRITQKLILQPRVEFDLAAQDVPELHIGAGLSSVEAGVRLRYEFVPEFAPYVGVEYERKTGQTADFARDAGEGTGGWRFLSGLRTWL